MIYSPKILASLREIRAEFRVGEKRVKRWFKMGAPIAREGEGTGARYSAEARELQTWRLRQRGNNGQL